MEERAATEARATSGRGILFGRLEKSPCGPFGKGDENRKRRNRGREHGSMREKLYGGEGISPIRINILHLLPSPGESIMKPGGTQSGSSSVPSSIQPPGPVPAAEKQTIRTMHA
jgi:hypothetical protein